MEVMQKYLITDQKRFFYEQKDSLQEWKKIGNIFNELENNNFYKLIKISEILKSVKKNHFLKKKKKSRIQKIQ